MPKHPRESSDLVNDTDEHCIKQEAHDEDLRVNYTPTETVLKHPASETADGDVKVKELKFTASEHRVKEEEEEESGQEEEESGQKEDEYVPSPPPKKRRAAKTGRESKARSKASPMPSSVGMAKTGRESKASPTPSSAGAAKGTAWTADEDALLLALRNHTDMSWGDTAIAISTHDSKSCQNRLGKLKKDPAAVEAAKVAGDGKGWTKAQDAMLRALRIAGMQWKEVASIIPGRDMKSCQNRWSKLKKEVMDS